jgi:alkylhydroperoxidase family enzyme
VALHERRLAALGAPAALTLALEQAGPLPDERLEVLRQFILSALSRRGAVDGPEFEAFLAHGFTHEQALDVILGISVYTLTTFANRLTETSEA